MPIDQDRMITLIEIIDEITLNTDRIIGAASAEASTAIEEFFSSEGSTNPLACNLLARIQSIDSLLNETRISYKSLETITKEREHFKLRKNSNARAKNYMQRKRKETETTS